MPLQPGQMIGDHHRIIEEIGHGGMSTVYSAWDTRLEREDAIKVMRAQYADDPMFAARFKQEAQAAASLRSPHIVDIYDWNEDNGDYYIVMERLVGADLKQIIERKGAIDGSYVARIAAQVCSALSLAHANDIIHRDIKPNNIMIMKDGNVKVMDFGIAKSKNSHLTTDNSVWGTANYVSPEQVQGKELGPTSDIYSLGVVMYEAVTGQLPFVDNDAIAVALKQINDIPIPPSDLVPDVDPVLEDIILQCMEKDPARRFQTAAELRTALLSYVKGMGSTSNGYAPRNPRDVDPTRMSPVVRGNGGQQNGIGFMHEQQPPQQQQQEHELTPKGNWFTNLSTGAKVGIAGLIIAVIAGFFIIQSLLSSPPVPETATVPNVVGEMSEDAQKRIEDADLAVGKIEEVWGTNEDEGKVITQDPKGMSVVDKGSKVNLTVSKGEKPVDKVSVPSLVGKTGDEARKALEELGLVANQTHAYSASVEKDHVVSQSEDAGTEVPAGTTIEYVVSLGKDLIQIPDVTGMTQAKAAEELGNKGFKVAVETVTDEGTEGIVRNYSPEGQYEKGTTVTIYVTKKPEIKMVKVPEVAGMSEESAKALLTAAGFQVTVSDQSFAYGVGYTDGMVVTYAPDGEQPEGSTVHIVVADVAAAPTDTPTGADGTGGGNTGGNAGSNTGGNTAGGNGNNAG